jgi:hypothetical protein
MGREGLRARGSGLVMRCARLSRGSLQPVHNSVFSLVWLWREHLQSLRMSTFPARTFAFHQIELRAATSLVFSDA